jgi:FlaA1/EpsC-like NDP-sugar epimerase
MTARRPAAMRAVPLVHRSPSELLPIAAPSTSPMMGMLRLARDIRGRHLVVIDLLGIVMSAYLGLALGLDRLSGPLALPAFPLILILLIAVRLTVNLLLGMYRRRWRYASLPELGRIVWAAMLGSVVAMGVFYGTEAASRSQWTTGFPGSFWPIELMLSVGFVGGVRLGIRAASERFRSQASHGTRPLQSALLYGAGEAGAMIARSAFRFPSSGVLPVGFLDDNPSLHGLIVAGLRVHGDLNVMGEAAVATGATSLLITMPSAPGITVREVLDRAMHIGLDVRIVPSVSDLIDGSVDAHRLRRVRLEDLLRRPAVTEHAVNVEDIIRGRTVVITGGGGSIGSELARQVFAIGPRRLVLVDRAESPLYLILRELEARRAKGRGSGEIRIHLANVANRAAMDRLIAAEQPSVIFHAAAYKHVPMMEDHPSDAAFVNMGGTMAILDAAAAHNVERFVFVSTDKAVRPSSVMGASKRIGEMLVSETARATGRPYVSVRFGNVLGSQGSVVPIFKEQLENGEPLTITHPDMTRFFMTIPEASWLILDAAAIGRSGDLFVLDMGEPIRVMDLARDLARLSGRDPDSHPIEIIGLRPGEKLHEELFYDAEAVEPTESPSVRRTHSPVPPRDVRGDVRAMLAMANGTDEAALRKAILEYVRVHDGTETTNRDAAVSEGPAAVAPAVLADPATSTRAAFTSLS